MDDDLISLKLLIVSDAAAEREIVRHAALQASIPIEVSEVAAGDAAAGRERLAGDAYDIILFDSRMSKADRQTMLDAIRAAPNRPFAILIGPAEMKTRMVLTDGIEVDGTLPKPIDAEEVSELIAKCIRARLPTSVLIVDDSSTVRSVIRKVFQSSRYSLQPQEAEEGGAALDKARRQRFDFVFMDCHMPGMDGFAALAALRNDHPHAKVVMITGMRDMRIEDRARSEGASDFLYKPFFAKDIDAVLNRLFGLMRPRWN